MNYLYQLDPDDAEVLGVKAQALRRMAYVSTGANDRAHLMSQALALEGKVTLPRLIPPADGSIAAFPTTFVDYFRVRIDPVKSGKTDRVLRFDFTDGSSAGLHIRRAVAEFIADPHAYSRQPDVVLGMSPETWAEIYLSTADTHDLIANGSVEVTGGDDEEAARLIDIFDRYSPQRALVVPPATLVQDHM